MGRWQPYLYNAQPRNSMMDVPETFNPKAVTMASREPPKPRQKQEGPLVNFNRHPDSYLVLPYGNTNVKPMNPKVKLHVKVARWIQFALRLLNLVGAVGLLLCGIFIKGAQDTEGYIMRIPPGVDIVVALYAIYHLLRSAKSRPAASSASYHFFALVTDAGFIPFNVFTAILANRNYNEQAGMDGRWRTFFPTDEDTDKVLHTTWLAATTVAGLHCVSMVFDLYLVFVFRKIASLPPDMNPLEDNLTSRRKTKHKHKNSSISAITPLTADDKRFSAQSGATTAVGSRNSQADPLISEKEVEDMKMPFMHTRTTSDMTYSPHTPHSARHSRQSLYAQSQASKSRIDLNHRDDLHRRGDVNESETLAQRKAFLAQQAIKRSSRPNSMVSSKQEFYTPPTTATKDDASGDLGEVSLQESRQSLQSDNWFVHDGLYDDAEPKPLDAATRSMFGSKTQGYNAVLSDDVSDDEFDPPMVPQPLRMNPPTPPPAKAYAPSPVAKGTPPPLQRMGTKTSMSSEATFSRSPTRASQSKSRYYGDLQAATQGIRNSHSPSHSPDSSPTKKSFGPDQYPSAAKAYTTNPAPAATAFVSKSPMSLDKKTFSSVRRTGEAGYTPVQGQSPRVMSRTGVDYEGCSFDGEADLGTPGRRRDVSGKIAEEGRGGVGSLVGRWGGGLTYRRVSGMA